MRLLLALSLLALAGCNSTKEPPRYPWKTSLKLRLNPSNVEKLLERDPDALGMFSLVREREW